MMIPYPLKMCIRDRVEQAAMERVLSRFSQEFVDAMELFADSICCEFRSRLEQGLDSHPEGQ